MGIESNNTDILGHKIFFLYPSTVIQNEIVTELTQQEYEVYVVKDHAALRKSLSRYPNSIVFADIDEGMPEKEWEAWIQRIMSTPETSSTAIGIVSVNDDEVLRRKYINSVKVHCGYTVIRANLDLAIRQLVDILKAANAKGRRKYIRAVMDGSESTAMANLPINGVFVNAPIKDISVVGFSCSFAEDPELVKNTMFKDIQLKLQIMLLKVEAILFGSRMDGAVKIYVFLFTQRVDPEARMKVRKYIQQNLQSKMDSALKAPPPAAPAQPVSTPAAPSATPAAPAAQPTAQAEPTPPAAQSEAPPTPPVST